MKREIRKMERKGQAEIRTGLSERKTEGQIRQISLKEKEY